MDQAPL